MAETLFTPENLQRWKLPRDYAGAEWPEYYGAGVGQHRDSDALQRSNFRSMLRELGGESDTVHVVSESHWACGWVEWIAIHESDAATLAIADRIIGELADYPVVNESDWSELEYEDCAQTWEQCYSPRERVKYLRSHGCEMDFRMMRAAVNGDWGAAANILHSPSDILY